MLQNEEYINNIWQEFLEILQPWHQDRWFKKTYLDTIFDGVWKWGEKRYL